MGSTTVFNSIAAGVFDHRRHILSPLLDMSDRSLELERSLQEEKKKAAQHLDKSDRSFSSKSSPMGGISSRNSSRYQASPRELHSRVSSTTEYDALPRSLHDSKLSPDMSAHLMLSPDLAKKVAAVLNESSEPAVPKLMFNEITQTSKASSASSSSRCSEHGKFSNSSSSSACTSPDELNQHVSNVLSRSTHVLTSEEKPSDPYTYRSDLCGKEADDHSYLDKYLTPPHYNSPCSLTQRPVSGASPRLEEFSRHSTKPPGRTIPTSNKLDNGRQESTRGATPNTSPSSHSEAR